MDEKIEIADEAAASALRVARGPAVHVDPDLWMVIDDHPEAMGVDDFGIEGLTERLDVLAAFVRDFPDAPLEALYRHARSHGVHDRPSDGFDDVPAAFRIAYAVFRATLIEADRVFAEEARRAAAKAAADRPQPPVMVAAEDTILEQYGSIFDKVGDKAPLVNLGGPVRHIEDFGAVPGPVTGGEGGDATEHLEQLAGGAADQDHVDAAPVAGTGARAGADGDGLPGDDQHAAAAAPAEGESAAGAPAPAHDAEGAEGLADGATQPEQPDGVAGAAAADTPPEAPVADALEAKAKALSPARKKR